MVRVAVIGAGPAGIVTLKYLLEAENALGSEPVEVKLFECDTGVGGTFKARTYEDGELVSSARFTTFSDFRLKTAPDFLSVEQYLQYLEDYCSHFNLWPYMNFSCRVTKLEKQGGSHVLTYSTSEQQENTWKCDAVAVCSGLHVDPNIPLIDGIERVPVVIHSSQFKKREQFGSGKTVLILGVGETGADLAVLAITSPTKQVILCHRNGFHLATKMTDLPIDIARASLFDTMYLPTWLKRSNILWIFYDLYIRSILWLLWGTPHGWDQWVGEKVNDGSPSEIFFTKSGYKLAPYIGGRQRPKRPGLVQRLGSLAIKKPTPVDTRGREIEVAPWPERIDEDGVVHFRDDGNEYDNSGRGRPEYHDVRRRAIRPDMVVFCTGYEQRFPFLTGAGRGTAAAAAADVRGVWRRADPSVGFVGFLRPNLGAIPPLAEMQAQLWVLRLLRPAHLASRPLSRDDEPFYRLVTRDTSRLACGVDHESYVYQLALDMGSAPSFSEVLRVGFSSSFSSSSGKGVSGAWWKLPLAWALGANFNVKFRLCGPWKWHGAVEVMTCELWQTITRRSWFFGHFSTSILPILIFGPLSLLGFLYELLVAPILTLL